jgi:hypothetical protein
MTEKTPNYTPEMEARLVAVYNGEASQEERDTAVEALSNELNRTKRSVVAKLSRMGVYTAKEYRTKQGTKSVSKAALVGTIAAMVDVQEDVVGSLEKATKGALVIVANAIFEAQNEALFADVETEEVETA